MLHRAHDPVLLLANKIGPASFLLEDDRRTLAALPIRVIAVEADRDLVREADQTSQASVLTRGLACSWKMTGRGKRQIIAFHLPGDLPDILNLHGGTADACVTTLTPATFGIIRHDNLRALFNHPRIAAALWGAVVSDGAIAREWAVNLGRREGACRAAHLLCELLHRMHTIDEVEGDSFDLPITQEELGDALGMSTVHVSRCLQSLRSQGLISWKQGVLSVLNREALVEFGDFQESYLNTGRRAAAGVDQAQCNFCY
jgi:CRP-like cAMP-binding protein